MGPKHLVFKLYVSFVHVCASASTHAYGHVPLAGGAGLLPPRALQDQTEVVGFDGKYLYWIIHLAGPFLKFIFN